MQRETIQKLHQLSDEVDNRKEISQEAIKTAQDRYKDREVTIERGGKDVTITEKVLWDELFHLGFESQAGLKLKELHPEVFSNLTAQNAAADELRTFCINELGVDYTQMSLSDYLHITEKLFEVMIDEWGNGKTTVA